eukprot:TRINITY_DN3362_c0_g1_i2.p1 TRINITY_DN3362_c0_g1~~TRINITY_DN3362_c0_g1_i2.p1  ORF type:complete len:378 (-),score=82.64 TRINITY_DN3362_c0_g1_i2:36-1169(-)
MMSGFIYPVLSHWVWSEHGWLTSFTNDPLLGNGFIDFAGSGVVHVTGGISGFVGAKIVGKRRGRYDKRLEKIGIFKPQDVNAMALGTLILWFTWYGFNCGSTTKLSDNQFSVAGRVAVCTTLAGAISGATTLMITRYLDKEWNLPNTLNGLLGGLVGVTAPCAFIEPWAALIIGLLSGALYYVSSKLLVRIRVDDPLEVTCVHGVCGAWGTIAVGIFAKTEYIEDVLGFETDHGGVIYGGIQQLAVQCLGLVVILAWAGLWTTIIFYFLKQIKWLRVSKEHDQAALQKKMNDYEREQQLFHISKNQNIGDGPMEVQINDETSSSTTVSESDNIPVNGNNGIPMNNVTSTSSSYGISDDTTSGVAIFSDTTSSSFSSS